jgi:hypothetical protein
MNGTIKREQKNLTWQQFLWSCNITCLTPHMVTIKGKLLLLTHCIWWV